MVQSRSTRPEDVAVLEREEREEESGEVFDRVAFAMSAIDLVRPRDMTVAVCPGTRRLRVEAGRAWGRAAGERWAVVSIPANASRRAIALALTELSGGHDREGRPYALDILLRVPPGGEAPEHATVSES